MRNQQKNRQETPKPVSPCYWAPKKRESSPYERTKDFKVRVYGNKLKGDLKRRENRQRQLQQRSY